MKHYMDVSKNNGTPQIIHFNKVFHYKPSILGCFPIFGNTHITNLAAGDFSPGCHPTSSGMTHPELSVDYFDGH